MSQSGKTFLYLLGPTPALCCTDMELVKKVLTDRTDMFQKDYLNPSLDPVLGNGVVFATETTGSGAANSSTLLSTKGRSRLLSYKKKKSSFEHTGTKNLKRTL